MPDIGLNPPSSGNIHSFTGIATVAGIRFGHVVVSAGTGDHTDVALPAGAAATGVMGIVTDQMGPTGSATPCPFAMPATPRSISTSACR